MKKIIYAIFTIILLIIVLIFMKGWIMQKNCQNTTNQKVLLTCIIDKKEIIYNRDKHFYNYKKIIENHYDFKFTEFQNNYLEHDTDLFQKNYYFLISLCAFDKKCEIDEKKFQMSKLICLTYSKACFFQSRFIKDTELKKISICNQRTCNYKYLQYLMKYLNNCNKYDGKDIYEDEDLINYFNKNKNKICKNYTVDYEIKNIELLRGTYDIYFDFISDSKLETLN